MPPSGRGPGWPPSEEPWAKIGVPAVEAGTMIEGDEEVCDASRNQGAG